MGGKVREGCLKAWDGGCRDESGGRRAGAHSRDLRPARQAADRVGQRPADDRPHRAAVEVIARSAITRHVAGAVVCILARVCSAPQRRTATIARARVRIGRTRTEHARRAGAVCRAAPLPRADRDRVHVACKPELKPTSGANASGGYKGQFNAQRTLHSIVYMKMSLHSRSIRAVQRNSGRGVVRVRA